MPDEESTGGGIDSFLDRLSNELNDASGADDLANQRDDADDADKPDPGTQTPESKDEDLDSLRPQGSDDAKPDPLDDLSEAANKGSKGETPEDGGADDKEDDGAHADILASFDPDDQAKIREYLDNRLAEELKLTESAGGAFKRIKTENRELEQKVRELETRTAEPEALKAATERIEELEKKIALTEETNSALRLEDTQAYQDAVVKPQQEILAASDAIADRYGVDRDQLANVLGNPNRRELSDKLNQLLGDDVADADKFELYDLSRKTEATFAKRKELAENAEEALKEAEELASKEAERQALEARQGRVKAAEAVVARLKDKAGFLVDLVGKDVVESFVDANAEQPVDSLSESDKAFARFAFDSLIPLAKKIRALEDELATANDDIIKLRGSAPGGEKGGTPTGSEDTKEKDVPSMGTETAVDRISAALAGAA